MNCLSLDFVTYIQHQSRGFRTAGTFSVFLCFGEPMFYPEPGDSDHGLPNSQSACFGTANGIDVDRSRRDLRRFSGMCGRKAWDLSRGCL
jgi:hypothetical protein